MHLPSRACNACTSTGVRVFRPSLPSEFSVRVFRPMQWEQRSSKATRGSTLGFRPTAQLKSNAWKQRAPPTTQTRSSTLGFRPTAQLKRQPAVCKQTNRQHVDTHRPQAEQQATRRQPAVCKQSNRQHVDTHRPQAQQQATRRHSPAASRATGNT